MELIVLKNIAFENQLSIIATILAVLTVLLLYFQRHKNLPPGPWGLPVVGYFPFLKKPPHVGITELGKKYGSVISFYLGSVLVIMLGDYKAIKEAFVRQGNLFSGKPEANVFRINKTDKGLFMAECETASQHRRFILSSFKDFGLGTASLEQQLMVEIKHFLDKLSKENGKAQDIKIPIRISISNVIAMFEFGKRFEYSDEEFIEITKLSTESGKFIGTTAVNVFLPWIKYIPFTDKLTGSNHMKDINKRITVFFNRKIQENENNHIDGSRSHFIDAYLTERNSIMKKTSSEHCFTMNELLGNLKAIFGAGTETMTSYLLWSVLYILKYPEIEKKVLQEIDEVIGHSRDPAFSDKNNMPYTDAFMLEVHRHSSLVPFSITHSNTAETTLNGFLIPKRSHVIGNLWAVHHDKDLWENPDDFNPDRFINGQGKVEKPEYLIPFSIGKRNCIGESLANMQVFLYFITLLQNFDIKLPQGETLSTEPVYGIGLFPKPFKICAIPK